MKTERESRVDVKLDLAINFIGLITAFFKTRRIYSIFNRNSLTGK